MSKIWFGNAEKMMWVKCPSTNIQRGRGKWTSSGGFLNGGAYAKSSPMSHRKYSIDWNLMESYEAAKIMSFYEGVYGQSPIQFVDPFAAKSNILPLHWSVPRLCAGGEAPTIGASAPTLVNAPNDQGYPGQSAVFSLAGSPTPSVQIPVPPGKNLHFGARGSASGSAAVSVTSSNGNPVIARNLATNPSFEVTSGTVEVRRNLSTRPRTTASLPVLTAGSAFSWGGTAPTLTQVAVSPSPTGGGYATRATSTVSQTCLAGADALIGGNVDVTVGETYTLSIYVRVSVALTVRAQAHWRDAGNGSVGTTTGSNVTFTPGKWERLSVTAVAPATAATVRTDVDFATAQTLPAGMTLDVDGLLVEASPVLGSYFDGAKSTDSDLAPSWTGTANASESILTGVGVEDAGTNGTSFAVSSQQWAGSGSRSVRTISRGTGTAYTDLGGGPGGLRYGMTGGKTYTILASYRLAAPQTGTLNSSARRIIVYYRTAPDPFLAIPPSPAAMSPNVAGEHRIRYTFTLPEGITEAFPRFFNGAEVGNGDVWLDNLAVIEGEYTGEWFDGDNPPSGYESVWDGAANASSSFYRERTTAILSPLTETEQTTMVLSDPGTVTVKLTGSGALTLNSMTATIGSAPPKSGVFRQGEGNTGLKFVGEPTRTGYSSAMDLESVSAEFVETGAWE